MKSLPLVVNFSPPFAKAFRLQQNPKLRTALENACVEFRKTTPKQATIDLFNLIHEADPCVREKTLNFYGFTTTPYNQANKSHTFLTPEQVLLMADEFLHQYKVINSNFLRVEPHPSYEEEFDVLAEVLKPFPVLFYSAVKKCKFFFEEHYDDILDCVKLLMSEDLITQQNGLRMIGHNYKYQNLLAPYAKEIGKLLQAMHSADLLQQEILSAQNARAAVTSSPFAKLSCLLEKKSDDEEEADTTHGYGVSKCVVLKPSEITTEQLVTPKDSTPLENLLNIIEKLPPSSDKVWEHFQVLRSFGINLNTMIDSPDYLFDILTAKKDADKLFDALCTAKTEYMKAKQKLSPNSQDEDISNAHLLRIAFNTANAKHTAAKDKLDNLCRGFKIIFGI